MKKVLMGLVGCVLAGASIFAVPVSADTFADTVLPWMHQQGLTIFNTVDSFRPDDEVTRGQAAKFVNQYAQLMELEKNYTQCTFSDIAGYDSTLVPHIAEVCAYGLLKGSEGRYMPNNGITEAQAMTVIMRTLHGFQDETGAVWYQSYYDLAKDAGIITTESVVGLDSVNITRSKLGTRFYQAANLEDDMSEEADMVDEMLEEMLGDEIFGDDTEEVSVPQGFVPYDAEQVGDALAAGQTTILFFNAARCPSCRALGDDLGSSDIPDDVVVFDIDFDDSSALQSEYDVTKQHTLILLDGDQNEVKRDLVAITLDDLLEEFE